MIPTNRPDLFERGLAILQRYGEQTSIRGRFILLYLGFRRMGDALAKLNDPRATPASEIEEFLDRLYTKNHRPEPMVVLTSAFGQSTSPNAPWSTRTGETAPGNHYPTNTWRNNFNLQKGIGCPAESGLINTLLGNPLIRLSCPWMREDDEGRSQCGIVGTLYRGEEHSIWLRTTQEGYQVVDLDNPAVYGSYFSPRGRKIPLFVLIAVLYPHALPGVYPIRDAVGIPEFAHDFNFTVEQTLEIFDCDPESDENSEILIAAAGEMLRPPAQPAETPRDQPLPSTPEPALLNTGLVAEILVARDLERCGWSVSYTGNIRGLGYDLNATNSGNTLRVEVKSSIGLCTPELTEEEWHSAQKHAEQYVLAVVDFLGSPGQTIHYVRNPVATVVPAQRQSMVYRVARQDITALTVDAEFL